MVAWSNLRKVSFVAGVAGAGIGVVIFHKLSQQQSLTHAALTNRDKPINPCALWDTNWDCRDPESVIEPMKNKSLDEEKRYNNDLRKKTSKAVRHIILVRHGEYLLTTKKLTKRGCLQAKYTGQRLNCLGIKWDKIIASTMTRAKETAEIILNEIEFDPKKVSHCNLVREGEPISPQPPEGKVRPETYYNDEARIEAAFRRYIYRAKPSEQKDTYTLIVCHSNVIRYFVCRALQFPPEAWARLCINHASITWLTVSPTGRVWLKFLGDSGFIPAEYVTNVNLKQSSKSSELIV